MKHWTRLFTCVLCITVAFLILVSSPTSAKALGILVNQAPVSTAASTSGSINVSPVINSVSYSGISYEEEQMLSLINAERKAAGLTPLTVYPKLFEIARLKTKDLVSYGYFSHTSPTYGTPFAMMKLFGIKYRRAGENLAYNSSIYACHSAFMNSTGHRNNILNRYYTHIGLGIVYNGRSVYVTEMFIRK